MSKWNKLKSLFVVSDTAAKPADGGPIPGAPVDEAALLAMELPPGEVALLPASASAEAMGDTIDFQPLYDEAGIPNTDEVEALEKFLAGLDEHLPQASKLAAAKAFLGAIGKSPADVLRDAASKIRVVRAVEGAKRDWTQQQLATIQQEIDGLQKQIEERRAKAEEHQRTLEAVRSQCAVEEARLQGARVFFGAMGQLEEPPPAPPAAAKSR